MCLGGNWAIKPYIGIMLYFVGIIFVVVYAVSAAKAFWRGEDLLGIFVLTAIPSAMVAALAGYILGYSG